MNRKQKKDKFDNIVVVHLQHILVFTEFDSAVMFAFHMIVPKNYNFSNNSNKFLMQLQKYFKGRASFCIEITPSAQL